MRLLTTCASLVLCCLMHGQTMTNENASPVPGDLVLHFVGSGPLVGPGGAGVVWDMSGIEVDYEAEVIYESPALAQVFLLNWRES